MRRSGPHSTTALLTCKDRKVHGGVPRVLCHVRGVEDERKGAPGAPQKEVGNVY